MGLRVQVSGSKVQEIELCKHTWNEAHICAYIYIYIHIYPFIYICIYIYIDLYLVGQEMKFLLGSK